MIRCLITDGTAIRFFQHPGDESRWLRNLEYWMDRGIEILQIREPSLEARALAVLTRQVLNLPNPHGTRILVNDRADVAIACGAHGVHLRDGSVSPATFARPGFTVTVACHDPKRVAEIEGADYILLAPVFAPISKEYTGPVLGRQGLRVACSRTNTPVLALGGVTESLVPDCIAAGAAGFAAISYFASPDKV